MRHPRRHSRSSRNTQRFAWPLILIAVAFLMPPIPRGRTGPKTPAPVETRMTMAIPDYTTPAEPWRGEWTARLATVPTDSR